MKLYEKLDGGLVRRLVYDYIASHQGETIQSFAIKAGVKKRTVERVMTEKRIPTMPVLEPIIKGAGYELQIRNTKVPRCPCESCDHPGKDCSNVCFPFRDYVRALEKRKGQIRRLTNEKRPGR